MKKVLVFFGLIGFLITIFSGFYFFYYSSNEASKIISPLPENNNLIVYQLPTVTPFIIEPTLAPEKIKVTVKPLILGSSKDQKLPEFSGESIVAVDLSSGRTLLTKNEKQKRQIASLTKVMTAVITLEHSSLNDLITINDQAANIGESSMGLTSGEKLTVKELLYGLLLTSANDTAEALAYGVTYADRQLFINWMNEKVKELKLTETYFANPSGLDEHQNPSTYSTAYDLLIITKYALEHFPIFAEIVKTPKITLEKNYRRKAYELVNQLNLENGLPGVEGVKAGHTDLAGFCLITLANREDHRVLGVILGSLDTRKDASVLYDFAFKKIIKEKNGKSN